jgi:hypothetical protein
MLRLAGIVLSFALCVLPLLAGPSDPIQDLLRLPEPLPGQPVAPQGPRVIGELGNPADDAPLETVARYWAQRSDADAEGASERVKQRLLEACEARPEYLPGLLSRLPDTPLAHDRIKAILDKDLASPHFGKDWQHSVARYLMFHSRYFREDLIRAAEQAHDEDNSPSGEEELKALAKLDWPAAEPILKKHTASTNPRVGALAISLLYAHYGDEGGYRTRLKQLVEDRSAPGRARDIAADALLTTAWKGRDEWYVSLFRDPTLRQLQDGPLVMTPLGNIAMAPENWIAMLTELVSSPDRAAHDNAVECLIHGFQLKNARRDALLPLLPWLNDPKWSSASDRLRLIQSMDEIEMPEAVPGLIAVLDQDHDFDRSYAAEALAHYRDHRAVPALKRALERAADADHRMRIVQGLVACGGVDDEDAAKGIEAYASQIATEKGEEELIRASWDEDSARRIAPAVYVGAHLSRQKPPSETVVQRLLARVKVLQSTQPDLAKSLSVIIAKWSVQSVDRDLVKRIVNGKADALTIQAGIQRRESLRQSVGAELESAAAGSGTAAGIAVTLLNDRPRALVILQGSDSGAQRALLACARLARDPLPISELGRLLGSGDALLSTAAEAYLTAEDSTAARELVLARHRGGAMILGARQDYDPGHNTFSAFDQLEARLRDEARNGAEIFALLTAGYWGDAGQIIVRVEKDRADVTYAADPARYYLRDLSAAELAKLREFIASSRIEDQGPLAIPVHDGMQYEYFHVAKDGGRRVFMNNPGLGGSGGSVYDLVCDHFRNLPGAGKMELKYRLAGQVPGFKVLLADQRSQVLSVWAQGADVRLFVREDRDARAGGVALSANGGAQVTIESPQEPATPQWVSFADGKVGSPVRAPSGSELISLNDGMPPSMEIKPHFRPSPWLLNPGEYRYRVGDWNGKEGLWKGRAGHDPILILEGNCAFPIITPDGRWAVIAKTDGSWAEPNYVVRVDLASGKALKLDVPVADTFDPVAYVPAHGKILVMRAKDPESITGKKGVGPDQPEYRLVDPQTGATEIVSGEFAPLLEVSSRPLQPTGTPDEVWAAIFNAQKRTTEVGRYDTRRFAFRPTLSLPGIRFASSEMWIDEPNGQVYVAYNGHLLQMPLTGR